MTTTTTCSATLRTGARCERPTTGETDYCRGHEDGDLIDLETVDPCHATTTSGGDCRGFAQSGHDYCPRHEALGWTNAHGEPR